MATVERGDPTEVALVTAAAACGVDPEAARKAHELLAPYAFDSFRKRMTLVRVDGEGACAYVKGAPKVVLALSDRIRWRGQTVPLTDERRAMVIAEHDRLASEGLRLLAVAVRDVPVPLAGAADAVERDLVLLGLVAASPRRLSGT